jgi:hypothetical protein
LLSLSRRNALVPLAYILWKEGKTTEAKNFLREASGSMQKRLDEGEERFELRYEMARIYAIQGNNGEAYKWLQKAITAGWVDYRDAAMDPLLENLRGDAQFQKLTSQLKTRVQEMRKRGEKNLELQLLPQ